MIWTLSLFRLQFWLFNTGDSKWKLSMISKRDSHNSHIHEFCKLTMIPPSCLVRKRGFIKWGKCGFATSTSCLLNWSRIPVHGLRTFANATRKSANLSISGHTDWIWSLVADLIATPTTTYASTIASLLYYYNISFLTTFNFKECIPYTKTVTLLFVTF